MTKRQLRRNVIFIYAYLGAVLIIALSLKLGKIFDKIISEQLYAVLHDFSSIIVAIPATYLAHCFQRRLSFLSSLRHLWQDMVEAKNVLISFTHLGAPSKADFGMAHSSVSRVIDEMRSVYRNVGETREEIGRFPFEPLHDMRRTLDELGLSDNPVRQASARAQMIDRWNALRAGFLVEFSTPEPEHPILSRNACDPRREQRHL